MKYVRTKDKITTSNTATHELTKHICCAGYFRTLEKGAFVRIGREWWNFYGSWVDIIDENGTHYSIRPDEVKTVTKELPYADTIEELCDEFVLVNLEYLGQTNPKHYDTLYGIKTKNSFEQEGGITQAIEGGWYAIYGAIWTTGEHGEPILKSVAKMNEKGELELL